MLDLIKISGTTSPAFLAKQLNTTPAMVEAMLDTLEEQGYLQTLLKTCPSEKPCNSCSLASLCSLQSEQKPRIRVIRDVKYQ